jgi:hypothetical protein
VITDRFAYINIRETASGANGFLDTLRIMRNCRFEDADSPHLPLQGSLCAVNLKGHSGASLGRTAVAKLRPSERCFFSFVGLTMLSVAMLHGV